MTALEIIDAKLAELSHRELVGAGEVSDLLLDVRGAITGAAMYSPVTVTSTAVQELDDLDEVLERANR